MNRRLEVMIQRHEGLKLKPYNCPDGKLTIGYGRNLEETGLTMAEAYMLMRNDIGRIRSALSKLLWFTHLSPVRQDVVIDMVFNLGLYGFLKFEKTIASLKKGDYDTAAEEMKDSKWYKDVGNRAEELIQMMVTNHYQ